MTSPEDYFNTTDASASSASARRSSSEIGSQSGNENENGLLNQDENKPITPISSTPNLPRITLNSNHNSNDNSHVTSNRSTRFSSPVRQQTEYLKTNIPAYKKIKIDIDSNIFSCRNLDKSVSFDTVAKNYLGGFGSNNYGGSIYDDVYINKGENGDHDQEDESEDELNSRGRNKTAKHDPNLTDFLKPGKINGNERHRSPLPYARSPPSNTQYLSGSFSSLNNIEGGGFIKTSDGLVRTDYPTTPILTHDALTSCFKHPNYDKYIEDIDPRTYIVYISGRRHTWVALDYLVANLLHRGDHIVILTRIPEGFKNESISQRKIKSRHGFHLHRNRPYGRKSRSRSRSRGLNGNTNGTDPNSILKGVTNNLENYMGFLIGSEFEIKITIDLLLGESTKNILEESIRLYDPFAIVTSTKPNLRFQRKNTWLTSRITDRIVKCFAIPIIIVPAFTLNEFEINYFQKIISEKQLASNLNKINERLREFDISSQTIPSVPSTRELSHSKHDSLSDFNDTIVTSNKKNGSKEYNDNSINNDKINIISDNDSDSESSIYTSSSEDSTSSSLKDLTRTISNYNDILEQYVEDTEAKPIDENTFLARLNKVTDTTHKISLKFAENVKGTGSGAELVRSLTGLPQLEKKKSMLDDVLGPGNTNEEAMSRIKTSLYANSSYSSTSNMRPKSPLSGGNGGTSTPKTIKFSKDISTPDKLKSRTTDASTEVNDLRKFKSHVETNGNKRNNFEDRLLSPSMSQPQSTLTKSLSESKVKTLKNSSGKKKLSLRGLLGIKSKGKKDKDTNKKDKGNGKNS